MIVCNFDMHEYMFAIEGFARGSHLRQHIWEMMFAEHLPQMDDKTMDYCWWIMRRDIWSIYMEYKDSVPCGAVDFLHALAALHRGNRYFVKIKVEGQKCIHSCLCYKFQEHYRPLPLPFNEGKNAGRFNSYIPNGWVVDVEQQPMPNNEMVEIRHLDWWEDLSVYDKKIE